MTYERKAHTADVAVEATADTLGGVFAACADGMAAAMTEERPEAGERFAFEERAASREALLFDYLDRLIYERDVRGVLPVANEATVRPTTGNDEATVHPTTSEDEATTRHTTGDTDATGCHEDGEWVVDASARGVPLDQVHARDLKAVTYSEMDLSEREADDWRAYVVFDV